MNLFIKVKKLRPGDYIAQIDWNKGDAGEVGTPGAVKYGDTKMAAYQALKELLVSKGHTVLVTEMATN